MTAHLRVTVVVAMLAIVAGLAWFVGSGERAMFGAGAAQDAPPAEHAATAPSGLVAGAWDLATFEQTFGAKYQPEQVRKFLEELRATRGTCGLGKPDLVSARGGLFLLLCEHAERLLKIELDDEDRIAAYRVTTPPSQQ